MKSLAMVTTTLALATQLCVADNAAHPKAKVSYEDFKGLVAEVEAHRAERLVDLDTFLRMSKEPDVIILDTRSTFRYERIHLKGARHLSFTDFTQDNLRRVIPSPETKVLIYCNNNFEGNPVDFASKIAMPAARPLATATNPSSLRNTFALSRQFANQSKPLMMALNVPTYINLYGYGYHQVYELDELVDVNDPRIEFEGSLIARP